MAMHGHPLHVALLHLANAVAAGLALSAWAGLIPPIAAAFAIVLYAIQIWESDTVRRLTGRARP
jgi:protein-S-isoprenylcysteine O-methyltransferase Ste14